VTNHPERPRLATRDHAIKDVMPRATLHRSTRDLATEIPGVETISM